MDPTSQLLQRWRDGDEQGLHEVLALHLPAVLTIVRSELGRELRQKLESDDLVQDAIVEFLRYGPAMPPVDAAHFRALLVLIVRHTICDRSKWFQAARRRMDRERSLGSTTQATIPAADVDPAALAERADLTTRLRLALELLPERDRRVLVLRDWQGLSFAQVALDLGVGEEAARGAWRRAVGRLRGLMADLRTGGLPAALAAAGEGEGDGDHHDAVGPA
jgi:RNA polymerase sigma-70 factor (ECF subfamily)